MDWIEVNGAALRYDLSGSGERAIVLVHEMGGMLESWDGVVPALARRRRVLRYDTRGAGLSEKLRGGASLDVMAEDIAALLDALGVAQPVALAGIAVGAAIAMQFCLRFPSRAAALIAMGPAIGVAGDRCAATLARAARAEQGGMRAIVEDSLANAYPIEMQQDAARFRAFRARWLSTDPASFAAINRMLAGYDLTPSLPRIACPTLLLAGVHDRLRPPEVVEPLAKLIPGARFRTLETAHFMAVQTPDLVAEAIGGFLDAIGLR